MLTLVNKTDRRYLNPLRLGAYQQPVETRLAFEQSLYVPARTPRTRAGAMVASAGRVFNPVVGHAGIIVDTKPQGGKQGIGISDILEVHFPEVHIEGYGQA